ncbi:MAG: immunoglobulin domain-containing protein [Blastocatellia bacterium]
MRTSYKLAVLHGMIIRISSVLPRIVTLGLALAVVALALVGFTVMAQGPTAKLPELRLVNSVTDLNGGFVQPGDTLEYTLTLSNQSSRPVGAAFIAEFIPANTDYVADSARITAGANTGAKTDAMDDDQVDAFKAGDRVLQLNIGAGAGAGGQSGGLRGGALAPGESATIVFRVTVKTGLSEGEPIINGAQWGAEAVYPGADSNLVLNTVGPPLKLEKSVTDLNGGLAQPGDELEYKLTLTNQSFNPVGRTFIAEFIPKGVTYAANSVRITAGANTGAKTDTVDADQVDYFAAAGANGQINIFTGEGAGGGLIGGTLAPGESATIVFRVRVNTGAGIEAAIVNGANAGGNDIYPLANSNLVTTTVNCAPPAITAHPTSRAVCAGDERTFFVTADGSGLAYQWRKNGVNLPGATTNGLTLLNVTANDAGSYDVVVTNACGTVTSTAATLEVNTTLAITAQPVSLVRAAGQSAAFSVTAAGGGPNYQWRKDGVNIPGAIGSSFAIASVTPSHAGGYDVVATNACNAVTSSAATLTVNCQTISVRPVALPVGVVGTPYTQTITETGAAPPVTFSVSAGSLPAGFGLDGTTGALTGTPREAGQFQFTITATDANGCTSIGPYLLTITQSAVPECIQTICFRSAAFFSLNSGTPLIPNGSVIIGGVNSNSPIPSTDPRVKEALDEQVGTFNREFVAAQLNLLVANELGAGNVATALASNLSCYGLQFSSVTLSDGRGLSPQSPLSDLIAGATSVAKETGTDRDKCLLIRLFIALNGSAPDNVCNKPDGPVDLSGCQ